MKKSAMIRARVEPEIKKQAEAVFKEIGLNASEAIGLFYHQVKLTKGMPFAVNLTGKRPKSKVSSYAEAALVEQSKKMRPQERLNAFFNHSYLLAQMEKAGRKAGIARAGKRKAFKNAR
jgi:addiction module RelB/DinJ family antitoxin